MWIICGNGCGKVVDNLWIIVDNFTLCGYVDNLWITFHRLSTPIRSVNIRLLTTFPLFHNYYYYYY